MTLLRAFPGRSRDPVDVLVDEYPGDQAWDSFSRALDVDDGDIYAVAQAVAGDQGEWFERRVPALGNRSPKAVLRDHRKGETVIRSVLMRMP